MEISMELLKKYLKIFISAFMAGCFICFGATCYLICASHDDYSFKILGAFLFGIGLFSIIVFKLWLFTGKVGYVFENKWEYLLQLLICLIGNMLGVSLLAFILKQTYIIDDNVINLVSNMVGKKINESPIEMFTLSSMCGVMIYLAVEGYSKCEHVLGKVLFAFMPIVIFVLCGFEHVVANGAYFVYSGKFSLKIFAYFILMVLGNSCGSILTALGFKAINFLNK